MARTRSSLTTRVMTLFIIVTLLSFPIGTAFAKSEAGPTYSALSGAGTPDNPYLIRDCTQLAHVNVEPSANYRLATSLNCSGVAVEPIVDFTGEYFDGSNNEISGLNITDTTNAQVGLFRHVSEGSEIRDLGASATVYTIGTTATDLSVGILVGVNDGTLRNVRSSGEIDSTGTVGGLVGTNNGSINIASTNIYLYPQEGTTKIFGGLAGVNTATITNTRTYLGWTWGSNIADATCGGIVGEQSAGSLTNSYSIARMFDCRGNSITGGLIGTVSGASEISNSFTRLDRNHNSGLPFTGAIVGSNTANIDLSSTSYDGVKLSTENCESTATATCNKILDWKIFLTLDGPLYENWDIAQVDTLLQRQGIPWVINDPTWYLQNNSDPGEYNMPSINSSYANTLRAPTIDYVSASPTQAKFSWKPAAGSGVDEDGNATYCYCEANATEWDVYVGLVPEMQPGEEVNVTYELVATVPGSENRETLVSYTATNLDPSLYYDFIIRGRNHSSESEFSKSVEIKPLPQPLETPTSVEVLSGSATIQWNDAATTSDYYSVEYKKTSESQWRKQVATGFPNPYATISPLEPHTSYDFRVSATNVRGNSPPSGVLTLTTLEQNVYEITSCEELQAINNDPYGHYTLTQDIDCTGSSSFNEGKGFLPIGIDADLDDPQLDSLDLDLLTPFTGTLEGNGHSISHLEVKLQGFIGGLFAYIDGATINNLTIDGGHVIGSSSGEYTVYTDSPFTMLAAPLSALASNATIDNVTTNVDIKSNNLDGHVVLSAGLIGGVLPSAYGMDAEETNLSITNSHAQGDLEGMGTAGLIGATLPIDVIAAILDLPDIVSEGGEPPAYADLLGSRVNVAISDSTTTSDISCSLICAGIVAANGVNLSLTNVTRSGNTGTFATEISEGADEMTSILQMIGPITAGAVGINMPLSINENNATLTMDHVLIDGAIKGTATAGIIGLSLPAYRFHYQEFLNTYNQTVAGESINSLDDMMDLIYAFTDHSTLGKSFTVSSTTVNASNTCIIACTGVSLANFGYGEYNNVTVAGAITKSEADPNVIGDTMAMMAAFGPLTSGFVGINMPFSTTDAGGTGLNIVNSTVQSDLTGTAATGLSLLNLPGLSVDVGKFKEVMNSFIGVLEGDSPLYDEYTNRYGSGWDSDEALYSQYTEENVRWYSERVRDFAGYSFSVLSGTTALTVENTSIEGDITCSVLCAGVSGLSLGRIVVDGFTQLGDILNDNEDFLQGGNPLSMCPVQITAGVVGTQLILPLSVSNSTISGDITVNQAGEIPDDSLADVVDSIINPEDTGEDDYYNNDGWGYNYEYGSYGYFNGDGEFVPTDGYPNDSYGGSEVEDLFGSEENMIRIACGIGSSFFQGTGGVVGNFISPIEPSHAIDTLFDAEQGTTPEWVTTISNTANHGNITSNSPSATGGLIGYSFGESRINGSTNSGMITNSTFAEMFRTPIASAATGGLVGQSIGAFALEGDLPEFAAQIGALVSGSINFDTLFDDLNDVAEPATLRMTRLSIDGSSSTGDVVSSNTAGGLVGSLSNGGRITKSFATGDVHGVTAGGLIGSGFNAASPLGLLDFFGSLEITNAYARGNIVASDAQDTFTFAGGLVGFMTHLGEFRINNAYSTGDISVRNDATDTRLVAGGFIGAELDLSIITQLVDVVIQKAGEKTTGDEEIDSYLGLISSDGTAALDLMTTFGMPLKYGFSITNSFTTSRVPSNTIDEADSIIQEIATGLPEAGVTSGSMFGFAFTVPEQEWRDLLDGVFDTFMAATSDDLEGETPFETDFAAGIIENLSDLDWASPSQLAPNSFYDASVTQTDRCANSLPDVADLILFELPKLTSLFSGSSEGLDVFSMIPPVEKLNGTDCGSVNLGGPNSTYFHNNSSVAPLNTWDFTSVWNTHVDDYPTFTADVLDNDNGGNTNGGNGGDGNTTPPPGTGTENPTTGGPGSFIPKKITPTELSKAIERIKGSVASRPLTEVLPKVLESTEKNLLDDVNKITEPEEDRGVIADVLGILSATGMFLLHNIVTVLLLLITGGLLWYYSRRGKGNGPKEDEDKAKEDFILGLHS